jgi:2-polyprenyl-6-methoxyphenol hydroxylase-like FAD-dependent oxidoreductase
MKTQSDVDIVVVGAGPVGLLAAIELTLGGASVLVLERLTEPSRVLKASGIGPLGVEVLRRRGMSEAIVEAQARAPGNRGARYSGHFAGLILIRREAQAEPDRLGSQIDQQGIEAMLGDRARSLGIEVRRGCEVKALIQGSDGIDVTWAASDGEGRTRCSWLVGCDGGRSTIRKLAGFAFPGCDPTMTMYQAIAEVDHPERLAPHGFQYTSGGMYMSFAGRLAMMDFSGPPTDRDAPITHEELEGALRRVSCADVRITAFENASRWTDNTRLVDTYRKGRVLLAGDAAHIHSPFGGQGLSLGLVDAANLGWKLAAVMRGTMPETLIDTYEAERRPVAEAVLANTLAQVAIMRPDPQSGAMREIMAKLLDCDDANRFIGGMMSGLANQYDLGAESGEAGRLIGDRPIGDGSLYDLMQDGAGVLLDASAGQRASALAVSMNARIRCVPVDVGPSMLIRPDACVAWSDQGDGVDGLEKALGRWFAHAQT